MIGLRLRGQSRALPAASANRRTSSARRSSGWITASTTSSDARCRMSMSSAYSRAQLLGAPRALVGVLDRLQLVVEDGVDRRLRAHHRDRRGRQREARVGVERRAGHRVQAGAVGLAHDHARAWAPSPRDTALIILAPWRMIPWRSTAVPIMKPGHVGQEQQRHVEGVAGPDEARRLVGRVDEQHAALVLGLVGDDPDGAAVQARVADDRPPSPSAGGPRGTSRRRRARRSAP